MNGYFVGGVGDGFLQGFDAANKYRLQREQMDREKKSDEENRSFRQAQLGIMQRQQDLAETKQAADANETKARLDLLTKGMGLDERRTDLAEKNQREQTDLAKKELAMKEGATNAQISENQAQTEGIRQKNYIQNQAIIGQRLAKRVPIWQQGGAVTPEDIKDMQDYGINLNSMVDGTIKPALQTFDEVHNNPALLHDPAYKGRINQALDMMFPNVAKRGIGEEIDRDGKKYRITNKAFQDAYVVKGLKGVPDNSLAFHFRVTAEPVDGGQPITYDAPLTVNGTADPNDPVAAVPPEYLQKMGGVYAVTDHLLNEVPDFRANVIKGLQESMKAGYGESDRKTNAEIERTQAQTKTEASKQKAYEAKAKADEAKARGDTGGAKAMTQKQKADQILKMVDKDYGDINQMANPDAAKQDLGSKVRERALKLAEKGTDPSEAYYQAKQEIEGGGKKSPTEDMKYVGKDRKTGKPVYEDKEGNRFIDDGE